MKYRVVTIVIFLSLLLSCGKSTSEDVNSQKVVDIISEVDTIVPAEQQIPKSDSIILPGKLASKAEAFNFINSSSDSSKYHEGILLRMIDENFPYAEKLLNSKYKHFIVVDKGRMKVILYDRYGRVTLEYGMACGKKYGTKHKKADSRTPEGFFSAEGVYDSTDWLFTDDNGVTSKKKGQFGPRFIRIKIPTTSQIGIHGTCAPWSIGGRVSHGCIRVTNENILELVEYVEVGMPIIVSPGGRDMGMNEAEGYFVPAVTTGKNPIKLIKMQLESEVVDSLVDTTTVVIDSLANVVSIDTIKFNTDSINVEVIPELTDSI